MGMRFLLLVSLCFWLGPLAVALEHSRRTEVDHVFANYNEVFDRTNNMEEAVNDWYQVTPRKKGGRLKRRWSSKSMSRKKKHHSECGKKYGKQRHSGDCSKSKKKMKKRKKSKTMKQGKGKGSRSPSSKGVFTSFPTVSEPSVSTPFPTSPSQPSTSSPSLAPAILLPPVDIAPPSKKTSSPVATMPPPPQATPAPVEMPVSLPTFPSDAPVPVTQPTSPPLPVASPTNSPTVAPSTMTVETQAPVTMVDPTESPLASPTTTPIAIGLPTPSPLPPTAQPTVSPTIEPTNTPTSTPISMVMPTSSPVPPTDAPTIQQTLSPTLSPTSTPTTEPTMSPTGSPTMQPVVGTEAPSTDAPTMAPTVSPTDPLTAAPTITLEARSTPFEIIYTIEGVVDPDDFEIFGAAQVATLEFLESYFFEIFGERDGTDLASFAGEIIESEPDVPSASFVAEFFFEPTTTFVPSQVELDFLIEAAFIEEPYRSNFLSRMADLGPDNVFSTTSDAQYIPRDDLDVDIRNGGPKDGLKLNYTNYGAAPLRMTPFAIDYSTNGRDPTMNETIRAVQLTLSFMDEYFRAAFDSAFPGSYQLLVGSGRPSATDATRIGYLVGIHAKEDAVNEVSQQDLDEEVERAFVSPAADALLLLLNSLPDENPFSTTISVTFESVPSLVDPENSEAFSAVMVSVVVIGGCLFVIAGICVVELRRKKALRRKFVGPNVILTINDRNQYNALSECSDPLEHRLSHISEEGGDLGGTQQQWVREYDNEEETIEFDLKEEFIKRNKEDPLARVR